MSLGITAPQDELTVADHECIPFASVPHSTALYLDYLSYSRNVAAFYPHKPAVADVAKYAASLEFPAERRSRVAAALERQNRAFGSSQAVFENIERLRRGAVAAVSGQQVGLFGGPLYSILKAVSAIQLARDLTARGIDAVPVFWLATEDHDIDEVNHTFIPVDGRLRKFATSARGRGEPPVGEIVFGEEIEAVAKHFTGALGDGAVAEAVRESYRAGETLGSAFAKLFARLFGEHGLILLDPLDAELHAIAAPVLRSAAERAEELDAALLARGKQLRAAGYHEQVKVTAASTLLFSLEGGQRTVVRRAEQDFIIGAQKVARAELLDKVSAHPEMFSANVLLRPIMQDYLLPTAAYFGGAAEIAYFAQVSVVYEKLLGRVTPVMPRFTATIVDERMASLLRRYRISLMDLFHGSDDLVEKIAGASLPAALQHEFSSATDAIRTSLDAIERHLRTLDPTLVEAAERSGRKMQYQVAKIRRKAARAAARKEPQLIEHADAILTELFPNKGLQERTIPGVYFLARNKDLVAELLKAAGGYCPGHHLVRT